MAQIGKVSGFAYIVAEGLKLKHFNKDIDKAREKKDISLEKQIIHNVTHTWGSKVMSHFDVHVEIKNEDKIPKDGPVVYVCNHQSYFDMFSLFSIIPHQFNFIAKMEWAKIPFFGPFIKNTRGLLLDRGNMRQALEVVNEGSDYLRQGFSLAVFPEGTRSKCEKMGPMKAGSYKLATKSGVPIVPVTISGSYKVFEEKDAFVTGQTIHFTFHDPIQTDGMSHEDIAKLPERVLNIIQSDL